MGEALFILSGIAITVSGAITNVVPLLYGGLSIAGLGIISVFWR